MIGSLETVNKRESVLMNSPPTLGKFVTIVSVTGLRYENQIKVVNTASP